MSFSSTFMLDVQLQPGRPPMTSVDAGGDTAGWVADHRNALRAVVTEHGSVLVRGLGLRAADQVGVVFRRLAGDLMADREAFASRQASSDGVYSSTKWPSNQQMCMHHELSYRLEFPGLMLFAYAFLNEWTLAEEVHEYLVDVYGPDGLPFNTRFGNGDPIGEDVVQEINRVYEANTAREPWQPGDLMLVDNIRTAHSRESYQGPREVLVGLADAVRLGDCSPTIEGTVR